MQPKAHGELLSTPVLIGEFGPHSVAGTGALRGGRQVLLGHGQREGGGHTFLVGPVEQAVLAGGVAGEQPQGGQIPYSQPGAVQDIKVQPGGVARACLSPEGPGLPGAGLDRPPWTAPTGVSLGGHSPAEDCYQTWSGRFSPSLAERWRCPHP